MNALLPVTAVAALVSSFLSGLLGVGGGLVMSPLLLYVPTWLGVTPPTVKLVTSLAISQGVASCLIGVIRHGRYGYVSGRLVWLMGPPSAAGALLGGLLSGLLPDQLLLLLFAAMASIGAATLLLPMPLDLERTPPVDARQAVALGVVTGFIGGMVGLGGIGFTIGALYLLRIPPRVAIGTSFGVGLVGGVAGLIGKGVTSQWDPVLVLAVFIAAIAAVPVGTAIGVRTKPRVLTRMLAAVVAVAALRIAWSALT